MYIYIYIYTCIYTYMYSYESMSGTYYARKFPSKNAYSFLLKLHILVTYITRPHAQGVFSDLTAIVPSMDTNQNSFLHDLLGAIRSHDQYPPPMPSVKVCQHTHMYMYVYIHVYMYIFTHFYTTYSESQPVLDSCAPSLKVCLHICIYIVCIHCMYTYMYIYI